MGNLRASLRNWSNCECTIIPAESDMSEKISGNNAEALHKLIKLIVGCHHSRLIIALHNPTYLWKQIKVQQLYRSILTIHQPSFLPPLFFFYKLLPPEIYTLCNKPYPSHTVMNNDCSRPWRARAVLVLLLLVLKPEQTEKKKTGPNNFTLLRIGGIRWFITGNIGN